MARLTTNANNTNYNNGSSGLATSPQTKQTHYYYNHQDLINQKRRLKYSNNKLQTNNNLNTQGKTKQTNKPNDVQINNFNSISSPSNKATKDNLEPVYSYNDLINYGFEGVGSPKCKSALYAGTMSSYHGKAKIRKEPRLAKILLCIAHDKIMDRTLLNGLFKDVSIYTLNRNLQTLVNLKWIIRRGRGIRTDYYINPFLAVIWAKDTDSCIRLIQHATYKIDFFSLLNLPIINIAKSNKKIVNVETEFIELHGHALWVRAFLNGILSITFTFEDGTKHENYLPVNIHAQPKFEWQIKNDKKVRCTNPFGIKHYCIPLSWNLFDIQEAKMFSKTRRKSRYDKNLGELEFIHFDNSFKIFHYPDTQRYLMFTKPFDIALKKWNTKDCQYIEFCNFKTLQKLLTYRFVDGKRRKDLFDALGLKYKPISGRPKNSLFRVISTKI